MVNDQEPRYRLVDPDGNVVGSLFAESDGTLKLQEGTSGNDNELAFGTQGALEVEQLNSEITFASNYSSLQTAVNDAGSNSTVIVDATTYSEDVTIQSNSVSLIGSAQDASEINGKLTMSGNKCDVRNLRLTPGSGDALDISGFSSSAFDCNIEGTVSLGPGNQIRVLGCALNGNDLTILSSTQAAVFIGNSQVGNVTDNGGDTIQNEVSSNS